MNMIFNKSDLVGYESVDRTEAKRKALAKIVAAWESKQAKNATRFGGLGLLAVSLAACNTSSDDTAATPAATPAATTPTVTALSTALTTSSDIVTSTFTSADDSITAVGGATGRTFGTGDVLVDNSTTDNDTLTITTADGTTQAPSTVTGIENIIYNNTSLSAASAVNLQNITGAKVTVNHTGNAAVVDNTSAVTNIGSNMTVTYGTSVTGATSADIAAGAKNVTLNAGASELTVTTNGTADGITVNGGTGAAMSVTLTAGDKNATIVGGSTSPGDTNTQTVDAATVAGVNFTSGALAGNSVVGTDVNTVVFSNVASGTLTVGRTSGTTEATGTNVNIDGAETASDAVTLKAAGHIDLDIRGGGNEQIEALTVEGNGAAVTLHFDAADAPTTLTMAGSQSITAVLAAAQADAITTITDSTTAGTTTIQIADPIPGNAGHDYSTLAVDIIEFGGTATDTNNNTLVFANNATVKFGGTAAHTTIGTLDVTDGSATTTLADGAINLDLSQDATGNLTIEGTGDVLTTVNVTANAAQTSMSILGGSGVTINLSGSKNVTTTDSTGKALNAASLTGNLTATASANLLSITGGSGDDVITGITAQKMVVDGGAGNDTLKTSVNDTYYTATISGIEVIDISNAGVAADENVYFKASQMNGASFIINSTSSNGTNDDFLNIDTTNSVLAMDSSTINLSGLQFGNTNTPVVVNMSTLNTAAFTTAVTFNITGTSQVDTITGYANADTIAGGAGNDVINGGAGADDLSGDAGDDTITAGDGADSVNGGAGADTITGGLGIDTMTGGAGADDFVFSNTGADFTAATATALAAAADKITDFGASTTATAFDGDEIDIGAATGAIVTAATAAAAGTAQVATAGALAVFHADDDTLAEKITAVENALTAGMGQSVHFMDGGNTYIFISDGDNLVDANDALIELTGFDSTGKALVQQGGDLFIA